MPDWQSTTSVLPSWSTARPIDRLIVFHDRHHLVAVCPERGHAAAGETEKQLARDRGLAHGGDDSVGLRPGPSAIRVGRDRARRGLA